ncbi:glycosyltransferase [Terriglobus roseus]|uniref:Rhamnosyltransferase n=1 Tax=Terriglobus roseus TaxID=392734 RepID=A0A1G7NCT4_9BACT|nr:glycosyltransferase family 2 protein [Terriglobus roseus]SDF71843.1 rhamnosyltransferase [Terriglobus roseus]
MASHTSSSWKSLDALLKEEQEKNLASPLSEDQALETFATAMDSEHIRPHRLHLQDVAVIIPTYNAGADFELLRDSLIASGLEARQVLVLDSESKDKTREIATAAGFRVESISPRNFRHGKSRQFATSFVPQAKILVFMTQDAMLANVDAIRNLVSSFDDPAVGAAFGRQLPREVAGAIERHGRLFNYPDVSYVHVYEDRKRVGFRAIFFSNSFSAYRRDAFDAAGGFDPEVIIGEDSTMAAKMQANGWKTVYCSEAKVVHSHNFNFSQTVSRYFDTGVYHARKPELMETYGGAGGEGRKFVISEFNYLRKHDPLAIPRAAMLTVAKYLGYKLGRMEAHLPLSLKLKLTGQRSYWT